MKVPFTKPAKTYREQVKLLQERGMVISDTAKAEFHLQHLNYYRLSAYWLPFEEDHSTHQFIPGTRFDDVLNHYIFDRELRLLVLNAIECIEVSVRSQWAYYLGCSHGAHAHLEESLFDSYWKNNLKQLKEEVRRSKEIFIKHLKDKYEEQLPPVWAVCEVMSIRLLSKWYESLQPIPTRRAIASVYSINDELLESWLHHLSVVRNTCAHHSRLWNRKFTITPKLPKSKRNLLANEFKRDSHKLYNTLVILIHCMNIILPGHDWHTRIKRLIDTHKISLNAMDFPRDWNQRDIWQ